MKYTVEMPIAGSAWLVVDADSEEEAIEAFWAKIEVEEPTIEWDYHEHIVEGNVCHASTNSVSVTRVEDNDE